MKTNQNMKQTYLTYRNFYNAFLNLDLPVIVFDSSGIILLENEITEREILVESKCIYDLVNDWASLEELKKFTTLNNLHTLRLEISLLSKRFESHLPFLVTIVPVAGSEGRRFYFIAKEKIGLSKKSFHKNGQEGYFSSSPLKLEIPDISISTLHDIGNVLTSMICGIDVHERSEAFSQALNDLDHLLCKLKVMEKNGQLIKFFESNQKRNKFLIILDRLVKLSVTSKKEEFNFYSLLKTRMKHICDIIAVQQNYVKLEKVVITEVSFYQVIKDCLLINEFRVLKPYIKIHNKCDKNIKMMADKVGVVQLLSNIFINSVESIEERIRKDSSFDFGDIIITSTLKDGYFFIEVSDNGVGFDSDCASQLFDFGFSTKSRSSGFGLHGCWHFMNMYGGDLDIRSDGPLKGATVSLTWRL